MLYNYDIYRENIAYKFNGVINLSFTESALDAFDIPYETVLDIPKIVIAGRERIYVENYISVLEYKTDNIKLKYKTGVIELLGSKFEIIGLNEGNISVSGKLSSVRFI